MNLGENMSKALVFTGLMFCFFVSSGVAGAASKAPRTALTNGETAILQEKIHNVSVCTAKEMGSMDVIMRPTTPNDTMQLASIFASECMRPIVKYLSDLNMHTTFIDAVMEKESAYAKRGAYMYLVVFHSKETKHLLQPMQ